MSHSIQTECPSCRQLLMLDADHVGALVKCARCQTAFAAVKFKSVSSNGGSGVMAILVTDEPEESIETSSRETLDVASESASTTVSGEWSQKRIGRYELRKLLGQGGFGKVYLAFDPDLERVVALKVLTLGLGQKNRIQRFLIEAKAAARLKHPNIVPTYVSGQADGKYFIASEFIEGELLSKRLKRQTYSPAQAARIVRKLASALAYAHENDVVHRDVKPHNIMIDQRGEPHLMDFGLAKRVDDDSKVTSDGSVLGTPAYMSPEQARGEVSSVGPASDQYSLAVVLFQMLTGTTPFQGPPHLVIADVARGNVPAVSSLRSDLSRDLAAVCDRALRSEPKDRYASCQEFAADLKNWLENRPVTARPLTAYQELSRYLAEHKIVASFAAAILTLLLLTMISLGVIWKRAKQRELGVGATAAAKDDSPNNNQGQSSTGISEQQQARDGAQKASANSNVAMADSSEVRTDKKSPRAAEKLSSPGLDGLRAKGAFGFPQAAALVLYDDSDLRLSAVSDGQFLFVQAVLWNDGDESTGKAEDGREIGDHSSLALDLDGDKKITPSVDRDYLLNPWPTLPGLNYVVHLAGNATTTVKSDSAGTGSIRYLEVGGQKKVRVDSFVLPLSELNLAADSVIRGVFKTDSPLPKFKFLTPEFELDLSRIPGTFDLSAVPDGKSVSPSTSSPPAEVMNLAVGQLPPEIDAADWLNTNSPASLESLRGKTVLVEFWATWCGPCIAGIPHLNQMQKKYQDKGFRILSLTAEDRETVEAFQKTRQEPIEYTVGLESQSSKTYGVSGIPAAFLVGTDGKLLWNGHPSSTECEEAIAKALGLPVPASPAQDDQTSRTPGKVTDVGKTLEAAARKKSIHDALMKKIEQSKKEVESFKRGYIIVGRVETPGSTDPETVRSQMAIEQDGFFADAVGDLKRPIGFRQLGYRPFDLVIPEGAAPDANGIIDVGTLVMEQVPQSELRRATGKITLEGGGSPEAGNVTILLTLGPINTPHNGSEGLRRIRPDAKATIDSSGHLIADGLAPGDYWVTYSMPGFVLLSLGRVKVEPQQDLILNPVELEKPRRVSVEFVVAKDSTAGFDASLIRKDEFPAGKFWKVGTEAAQYGWDLEFGQVRRSVTFNYSYVPCTIADLGEGNLADFLKPPSDAVQKDPRTVSVTSGHVYLLKQGHWKHDVLFRVEISEPAPGNVSVDSSGNVPSVAATLSAKLASFGGRACRAHLHPHL